MSNILLPEDIINLILSYAPDFRDNLKKCQTELLFYHRPCYYKKVRCGFKPGISDSPTWHNFSARNNRIPIHYKINEGLHKTIHLNLYYGWSKITNPHFWNTITEANSLYDTFTPGRY